MSKPFWTGFVDGYVRGFKWCAPPAIVVCLHLAVQGSWVAFGLACGWGATWFYIMWRDRP